MHEMEKKLLAYCQRIATCSVFRRADEYVRYDFISHGFGWRREFNPTIGAKTAWLWVNSYRSAWVSFDLMNSVGWGRADKSKRFQVYHSGSMVKPNLPAPLGPAPSLRLAAVFAAAISSRVALTSLDLPSRSTCSVTVLPGLVAAISLRNAFVSTTGRP